MRTHRWLAPVAAVAVALAGGCANHQVDKATWAQELRESGLDAFDIDKLAKVYVNDLCRDDVHELASFLALSADAGDLHMDLERLNFRNACPDRLDELDEAFAAMPEIRREAATACDTPAEQRTADQALRAEAFGCL